MQFYSASFLRDMYEVVAHVSNRYPAANLYAIGWSLGANILVRYSGHESHSCLLSGAVFLSNPFNLIIADEDFHKGFNNVYDKALANSLCKIFIKHALLFEVMQGEYNISLAVNTKTVREFDDELRFHYKCMYSSSLYPSKSFQPFTLHCSFLFVVIYRTSDAIYRSTVHGQES
ncbi:embryogenesis-associated protein EMB8-like isoform X2 [Solanum pennellii]|uniref:Embryogenesis-associated protein EMB8-like isoform X2 n=1 Tax=Solanum pennellii TaxID=28526 RepID=A0ABM1HFK3_SOLPN|nr:embryogenesis-associated protein EMB8-like isoform X2 [Solanum pennellii]